MGKPAGGKYDTDFIWGMASHIKPMWNKCYLFLLRNIVMYLAEFCICVPLIPKYVVYIAQPIPTRLYHFAHSKNYITFLPSLNLNPSVCARSSILIVLSTAFIAQAWKTKFGSCFQSNNIRHKQKRGYRMNFVRKSSPCENLKTLANFFYIHAVLKAADDKSWIKCST